MKNFTAQSPEQGIIYTSFQTKLDKLPDLPAAKKAELLADTKKQLQTAVYPAYQSLITYFTAPLNYRRGRLEISQWGGLLRPLPAAEYHDQFKR